MKNRLTILIFIVIMIAMVSAFTLGCVDKTDASSHITDKEFQAAWNEIYAEGEYEADGVVVILTREETRKFKTYTAEDFAEAGDLVIQQDDYRRASYMKAVLAGETNTQMPWLDAETYQQGLSLRLTTPTKENIVRACILLSRRPEVEEVYPVAYADITAGKTPKSIHDPYYITEEEYRIRESVLFKYVTEYEDDRVTCKMTLEETRLFKTYTINDYVDIGIAEIRFDDSKRAEYYKNILQGLPTEDHYSGDPEEYRRGLDMITAVAGRDGLIRVCTLLLRKNGIEKVNVQGKIRISDSGSGPTNINFWYYNSDHLDLEHAWEITKGSPSVLVGVLDSGIDGNHNDLIHQMDNSTPTLHRDFTTGLTNGTPVGVNVLEDNFGHGTHVAGIIAAEGIDGQPIGVAPNVRLVSLRVYRYAGTINPITGKPDLITNIDWVTNAINYANNKIKILNISFNWDISNTEIETAIDNFNGIIICSAGNDNQDIDVPDDPNDPTDSPFRIFPSNYGYSKVIIVGNSTSSNERYQNSNGGSNYGSDSVDLFAPGFYIQSTLPTSEVLYMDGKGYGCLTGTSMSAPMVTGVAALLMSRYPSITAAQIKAHILNNVTDVSDLHGLCVTGGMVNAYNALQINATPTVSTNAQTHTLTYTNCPSCGGTHVVTEAHTYNTITYDGTAHYGMCTICGYTMNAAHTFGEYQCSGTSHSRSCTVCGYMETNAHTYGAYEYDSVSHSRTCTACGYTTTNAHLFQYTNLGETQGHRRTCRNCGYTSVQNHTWHYNPAIGMNVCTQCSAKSHTGQSPQFGPTPELE